MSDASHEHDGAYASGTGYEPDLGTRTTAVILAYVVVLSAIFFITLGALIVYFKWEADREMSRKVFTVESTELKQLRSDEDQKLTGIDQAMKAVASETR